MMKKRMMLLLLLILALLFSVRTEAATLADAETVTVTGRGVVAAPADSVQIRFGIEGVGKDEQEAAQRCSAIFATIKERLASFGKISRESYFSGKDCRGGTVVTENLVLISNAPKKAKEITDLLIESGVTEIFCVSFTLRDRGKYEKEALKLAVLDAESRAASLGVTLKPCELQEFGSYCGFGEFGSDNEGIVEIECTVNLTYRK